MQTIPITHLVIIALPALLVLIILRRWSDSAGRSAYALARMVIQLCLIGYALTFIFETESSNNAATYTLRPYWPPLSLILACSG
jgi:putative ABC transport system permease protein